MRNLLSSLSVVSQEEITPEGDEEQLIIWRMCNLLSSLSVVAQEEITPEGDEEQLIMRRMKNLLSSFSVVAREEITPEEGQGTADHAAHEELIVLFFSCGPRGDHA